MSIDWLRKHWDRAGGWALVVVGLAVLYVGWTRASDEVYPAAQLPYIVSGGVGGALLAVLGATLLVSADLRDQWHKLDEIADILRGSREEAPPEATSASDEPLTSDDGDVPVGAGTGNGRHPRAVQLRASPPESA